jgi:multidrug efflux pump subunit AcrA (membrane-fusion protein)
MRCVLIVDEKIAAVSDCSTLPTAPGWKAAWYGETYAVGEPVLLFDENLRRKPIDAGSVYGRAAAEKQKAAETARLARIDADNAAQDRKNAEADLEKAHAQIEVLQETVARKTAEEKALLECANTAERAVLEKEEAERNALRSLTEKIGEGLNTFRDTFLEKTFEQKSEEPEKQADVKPSTGKKEKKDK